MADVLLIDDMVLVGGAVKGILTREGHEVTEAAGSEAGIALLRRQRFDLVVTDVGLPGQDGCPVLSFVGAMSERPAILAIAGRGCPGKRMLQMRTGVPAAVMAKPFDKRELVAMVESLLAPARRRRA